MTNHNGSNMAHIPLSSREEQVEQANHLEALMTILSEAYGITPLDVQRLPIGQATLNYKVVCSKQNVFVKRYLPDTDLAACSAAIHLSLIAGKAGVPVAQLFHSHTGEWITTHGETTISVWKYVDGRTITTYLNESQFQATGAALGRIHRQFASLVESRGIQRSPQAWLAVDVAKTEQKIDQLLDIIATRSVMDEFDSIAQESLRERRAMLPSVSPLLNGIPNLTSQILHGDYSALNLLFTDTAVAAVLDFRPPERFLIAYEIGRIAFGGRKWPLSEEILAAFCSLSPE
jgi:Ser/Thr protein kinase RdoA (MazF antagonist)